MARACETIRFLVTSASGANGDGYGMVLGFTAEGALTGPFSADHRVTDPRGLSLDPSGELVYLNSGDDRVLALDRHGKVVLDSGRMDGLDPGGGTFGPDGRYYVGLRRRRTILALPARLSGVGPSGEGENTIAVFGPGGALRTPRLVNDPELSPLDLTVAPNGNIMVSSEWPGRDHVVSFASSTGRFASVVARLERLNGQALVLA